MMDDPQILSGTILSNKTVIKTQKVLKQQTYTITTCLLVKRQNSEESMSK